MSDQATVQITVHGAIKEIPAQEWNSVARDRPDGRARDPFTTHRFLSALEDSGSVGASTGWAPRHLAARSSGVLIGAMPLYAKGHSQGEYVFDHNWAHAYERAGGRYYPKLQAAVPFTPATGRRFLTHPQHRDTARAAMLEGALRLTEQNRLSSFHMTFCTPDEAEAGEAMGLLHRTGQQFHWENDGYADFDAFLSRLSSRKRKAVRREREGAREFGGTIHPLTGDDIRPEHWDAFWQFYQDTGARKWGTPYLTRAFFEEMQTHMRNDILLILCRRNGRWIAGALNFIGRETLFGRYWGCLEDHRFLHFETCYYQAIDFAIKHGLSRVEAGAQGEHKLARGYMPVTTHSLHWIADEGFRNAVREYLDAERSAVTEDIDILTGYGPFRRGPGGGD